MDEPDRYPLALANVLDHEDFTAARAWTKLGRLTWVSEWSRRIEWDHRQEGVQLWLGSLRPGLGSNGHGISSDGEIDKASANRTSVPIFAFRAPRSIR